MIIRRMLISMFLVLFTVFTHHQSYAADAVNAYLFYGEGCPHCAKERTYLDTLKLKYPELKISSYEIYYHPENDQLLQQVAQKLNTTVSGVPFLVIGDEPFVGFADGISADLIEHQVSECLKNGCSDQIGALLNPPLLASPMPKVQDTSPTPIPKPSTATIKSINVPLIGQINLATLSLPVLTFILAFLDGFNPCAMWTLLFLISLLLGLKDKKRMWILGTAFIIASASVYFLFLSAWLNLFLFIGFVIWVRALIGIVAISAGFYYLRDYWQNTKGGCQVMGDQKRQQIFTKLRAITQKRSLLLALGGIVLLAIAVNLVELICSAGLPAIYTQILSLANLPRWQYYLYLIFYILVFMLDDLFVFFTAMTTLQAVGVNSKYSRYSHLIGGILMSIIGLLMLFKPEWLMFG